MSGFVFFFSSFFYNMDFLFIDSARRWNTKERSEFCWDISEQLRSGLLGLHKFFSLGTFNLWMFTDNNSHSPEYRLVSSAYNQQMLSWSHCYFSLSHFAVSGPSFEIFFFFFFWPLASLVLQNVKNPPAMQENLVWSLGKEDPWRREWLPTPVFLPGEFHGQRSMAGYSSWGCKESDTAKWLTLSLCMV